MKKVFLVIALLAAVPTMLPAADDAMFDEEEEEDAPLKTSLHVYPFAERFRWMEFFDGGQVQEDEGDLYGAGAQVAFESGRSLFRLKGEYFRGTLDVEGNAGGFPWGTEATYYGFRLEGDGAWKYPVGRASIGPVLGVGYRWWRRDYENSTTVDGWLERWHMGYFKIGALAECDLGEFVPYAEAGLRLGVFANNEAKYMGTRVSMSPGGRIMPYAEAGLKLSILKGAVYYERQEFSQSSPAPAPGLPSGWGLVQPESKVNIYGARLGIVF